jgi:hypothetical protein
VAQENRKKIRPEKPEKSHIATPFELASFVTARGASVATLPDYQ